MTLMSEGKRMTRYIQPCSFSRLISMMTLSLVDIEILSPLILYQCFDIVYQKKIDCQ